MQCPRLMRRTLHAAANYKSYNAAPLNLLYHPLKTLFPAAPAPPRLPIANLCLGP